MLSSGDASHWDRLFDRCASGASIVGVVEGADAGLAWRDWVNTGWSGRSSLHYVDQLRELVERWDFGPSDSRVTRVTP